LRDLARADWLQAAADGDVKYHLPNTETRAAYLSPCRYLTPHHRSVRGL
jgi:hypothetical protein